MQTKNNTGYIQYAIPILAYCLSSICMTVVNKVVLSAYKFKMNFLLLMFQVCTIKWKIQNILIIFNE